MTMLAGTAHANK